MSRPTARHRVGAPGSPTTASRRGWLAPALACVGALLAGGAWLAFSGDGDESGERTSGKGQVADRQQAGDSPKTSAGAAGASAATEAPAGGADSSIAVSNSGSGTQLNEEGYSLIQQGSFAEAIPVLRRAVASYPEGTTDITYAYALFNLGHALRMAGQPEAAIPILEQRLEIPNQTEVVQRELDAARAAAGQ